MAQPVRPASPGRHLPLGVAALDDAVQRDGGQRPVWRAHGEKDPPAARTRPSQPQVADDRLADERMERELFPAPALGPLEDDPVTAPVDVVETQSPHFAGSHAVDGQQQENRAVTDRCRFVASDRVEHPTDGLPWRTDGKSLQSVPSRSLNGRAQARPDPSALGAVIQPLAQGAGRSGERTPTPTQTHGLEEAVQVFGRNLAQGDSPLMQMVKEGLQMPAGRPAGSLGLPVELALAGEKCVQLVLVLTSITGWVRP